MSGCVCGSGLGYNQCCRPFHDGKAAPTAEALMRSRYSAYVLGDGAYLHRSWHPSTRPAKKTLLALPPTEWLGLEIVEVRGGGEQDQAGVVGFIAHYREGGSRQQLQETSRFVRENGRWYYVVAE